MDAQREEAAILRIPIPFSLNQPAEIFDLCPTDDTEWAAWTMINLLNHGCNVEEGWLTGAWKSLAMDGTSIRGWVSTLAALDNIRRGVEPPFSGRDNPHYFDDGAMCRAVPIGIANCGEPATASRAAALDASVTNFEDGVWVAGAVAAAISTACAGEPVPSVIDAAVRALPGESWSLRTVKNALTVSAEKPLELIVSLHGSFSPEYNDGCVGPENLAVALAIVSRLGGDFSSAVTTAAALARGADTVPAIVGALCGALASENLVSGLWEQKLSHLRGICFQSFSGLDYLQLVENFVETCFSRLYGKQDGVKDPE
jgi:ADP-ribosylglycohydrolase